MAGNAGEIGGGALPDELRCKRTDGKSWRCKRPVAPGKTMCENHYKQCRLRQKKEPVPDHLKFLREKPASVVPKTEEDGGENAGIRAPEEAGPSKLPAKRGKRKRNEEKPEVNISEKLDDALKKMKLKKGDLQLDLIRGFLKREVEKKKEKQLMTETQQDVVRELKYGRLEISQSSPSSAPITVNNAALLNVKVGVPATDPAPRRFFRSKNIDPLPVVTTKTAPAVKENIKSAAKYKKKCHWCKMTSYRVFVKCSKCKKQFFCEDCIQERYYDKASVKRECPVCLGTCSCRACKRERSKQVKPKELMVYTAEKKFDKTQQLLYLIHLLLPLLEQINQEKFAELDMEAKIKGKNHSELEIQLATDSQKQRCCFCKACIVELHRSCGNCSYILCVHCCREFREGHLHGGLRDFKYVRTDRRKSFCTILWNWKTSEDGSIKCPPMNLGGCGNGILDLKCLSPFSWTRDIELSARKLICNYKFTKPLEASSSCCLVCDGNRDKEIEKEGKILIKNKFLYFSTGQDLQDVEHFVKHWVNGQPIIIRDVLKSKPDLSWDPVFLFCTYLERSANSQQDKEGVKLKNCSDWCEVEIGRKQIFMGGKTHANVWQEMLKFKVWLSSGFLQEHFPSHYAAVIHALPLQEYINPLTGFLNLAAKLPQATRNLDFGPFIYISYCGPEELVQADFSTKLCYHSYDVVNVLVHATELPISEKKFNKVKNLMNKYSSQDHNKSSRKRRHHNTIDELFGKSSFNSEITQQSGLEDDNGEGLLIPNGEVCAISDDSSIGESEEDDSCHNEIGSSSSCGQKLVVDTRGAQWDIFSRQDVPKLIEYLRKYSNELNQSYSSPKKVVHPILDENFYLDAFHKMKLKEEFGIEPWTFEQHIGEAVIVPAGCPYQVKKIKSCVNVVLEFVSPESLSECINLSDELRQLPVNHKAKGKMLEVKKMAIYGMNAAIEEIHDLSQAEIRAKIEE